MNIVIKGADKAAPICVFSARTPNPAVASMMNHSDHSSEALKSGKERWEKREVGEDEEVTAHAGRAARAGAMTIRSTVKRGIVRGQINCSPCALKRPRLELQRLAVRCSCCFKTHLGSSHDS